MLNCFSNWNLNVIWGDPISKCFICFDSLPFWHQRLTFFFVQSIQDFVILCINITSDSGWKSITPLSTLLFLLIYIEQWPHLIFLVSSVWLQNSYCDCHMGFNSSDWTLKFHLSQIKSNFLPYTLTADIKLTLLRKDLSSSSKPNICNFFVRSSPLSFFYHTQYHNTIIPEKSQKQFSDS